MKNYIAHLVISLLVLTILSSSLGWAQIATITDDTQGTATNDGTIGLNEYVGFTTGINSDFGDLIGAGSMLYFDSDQSGNLNIALDAGTACCWNDIIVIYFDATDGIGFNDTNGLSDAADLHRTAVTVSSGSELTFAPGFTAEYALAISSSFTGLYELASPSLTFLKSPSTSVTSTSGNISFELSGLSTSDLGLSAGESFNYIVTLINPTTQYRSDEFHGVSPSTFSGTVGTSDLSLATGDYNTFESITPLELTTIDPTQNQFDVPRNSNLTLTFDQNIDGSSIDGGTPNDFGDDKILIRGEQSGFLTGTFSGDGTPTITFDPANDLKAGEIIIVTVTTNLIAQSGDMLGGSLSYQFTAAAEPSPETPAVFSSRQISANADIAYWVVSADLDGDGDQDVISASSGDDKIAWYENLDGLGHFGVEQIISNTMDLARSVVAADIDADGDLDLVAGSEFDMKLVWFENTDGLGAFSGEKSISTAAAGIRSVHSADIDGDGDMDVLSSSSQDDEVAWYENTDGLGTFGAQQIISTAAEFPQNVRAADIDGDGDMDVVSASIDDDEIAWYENLDGLGSFSTQKLVSSASDGASSVYPADIDGDGDLDLLTTAFFDHTVAWHENTDGAGTFGTRQTIDDVATGARVVRAEDVDGDGDLDALVAVETDNTVAWYENTDGMGSFSTKKVISDAVMQALSVYASDIDNDGDLDVLSAGFADDKIIWYENEDLVPTITYQLASEVIAEVIHKTSIDVSTEDNLPKGLTFSSDGMRLFMVGLAQQRVFQYDLSTAYDIATVTGPPDSYDLSAEAPSPNEVAFNSAGTKMFAVGLTGDVHQFSLTNPFDISSGVSADGSPFDLSTFEAQPEGITFNNDGSKMYIVGPNGQEINQFSLTNPFDITSGVTHDSSPYDISSWEVSPNAIAFNAEGTKAYVAGSSNGSIHQFRLTTPFDITAGVARDVGPYLVDAQEIFPQGIFFKPDGQKLFVVGNASTDVHEYDVVVPFSVSPDVSFDGTLDVTADETNGTNMAFNNDGTKMFVVGYGGNEVNQYSLSTPYDITSGVSNDGSPYDISGEVTSATDIAFSPDGLTMFIMNFQIKQFSLTTPFDVTSGVTPDPNPLLVNSESNPQGFTFSPDGKGIYVVGVSGPNAKLYYLSLATAFDISGGANLVGEVVDITAGDLVPVDITFNSLGTKMFIAGSSGDRINQYKLNRPFDISTSMFEGPFDVSEKPGLQGLLLTPDNSKFFIMDQNATSEISQYSFGSGEFLETMANDGSVQGKRVLSIFADEFENAGTTLNSSNYTIHNLPIGLEPNLAVAADGKSAALTLDGNAINNEDSDDLDNLIFTFSDAAFVTRPAGEIANSIDANSNFGIDFTNGSTLQVLTYSSSTEVNGDAFTEVDLDDGSVAGSLTIALANDTFTNAGGALASPTDFSITNLPSGLTASLSVAQDGLSAELTLSGNASSNAETDDIADLIFTFNNSSFTGGDASAIVNAIDAASGLGINFIDNDPPIFTSADATSTAEDNSGSVLDINANDGDGGANDAGVTYDISGGIDMSLFSVDNDDGQLSFINPPDFENPDDSDLDNVYLVDVTASDGVRMSIQNIAITVTDIDSAPLFTTLDMVSFAENSSAAVIDIDANDGDGGATDAGITYSLVGGADQGAFAIDAGTGALSFQSSPDFESPTDADTDNVYEVQVRASDGTNSTDQSIAVTVTDVSENNAPVMADQTFAIDENTSNGTSVGTMAATDGDSDPLTFSITAGNSLNGFVIGNSSGEITVADESALDFETTPAFQLTIEVNDGNGGITPATATINLNDVDENVTAINENVLSDLSVYPNPVNNQLQISINGEFTGHFSVGIASLDGRIVFEQEFQKLHQSWTKDIDVKQWPDGAYVLSITTESTFNNKLFIKN